MATTLLIIFKYLKWCGQIKKKKNILERLGSKKNNGEIVVVITLEEGTDGKRMRKKK